MGHWTNKLHQLFEDEYRNQRERSERKKTRGGSVLTNLRETLSTKYRSWSEGRRERRRDLTDLTEDMKEALEVRRQERMKRRETKLNLIAEELEGHKAQPASQELRKHLRMRTAKSVKYSPDTKPEEERYQASSRTLTLSQPLEIYVDGPFGSPSSNIYRAQHAVLIGTGIGESVRSFCHELNIF